MAADTVAGYTLLDDVQFRRSSYSLDRASLKAALDAFIRRAKGRRDQIRQSNTCSRLSVMMPASHHYSTSLASFTVL
jgi:hypothetical protein